MFRDARRQPKNSIVDFDLCIVGAGPAGITLALELARPSFRVCLLESGGRSPDSATQELYAGENRGRDYYPLDECRSRFLGGSSNCWAGMCAPLVADDFRERSWIPYSGWPFERTELAPYYRQAERLMGLDNFDYVRAPGSNPFEDHFNVGVMQTEYIQIAPIRFGQAYEDSINEAEEITAYLHANLFEFETDPEARAVQTAEVRCLDGNHFKVRARVFVLAAGGIENARLLLASNSTASEGLGNGRGLVGRFFQEHIHLPFAAYVPSEPIEVQGLIGSSEAREKYTLFRAIKLTDVTRRENRLTGFTCWFDRRLMKDATPFSAALERSAAAMDRLSRSTDDAKNTQSPTHNSYFGLLAELEPMPNPDSRVALSSARDALGMRRVELDWRLTSNDTDNALKVAELLAVQFAASGIGRLRPTLQPEDRQWHHLLNGSNHHMGTTRMHTDPHHGVVDADCKVHGVANLFVAGSSVFPTVGAANPTLTILAMVYRLAAHLRSQQ